MSDIDPGRSPQMLANAAASSAYEARIAAGNDVAVAKLAEAVEYLASAFAAGLARSSGIRIVGTSGGDQD